MARKARRRLPRAVKKALEEQHREEHAAEVIAPIQQQPAVLVKPPSVKREPLLLPASTHENQTEALVTSHRSARPDELLRSMGQQVLVGQQVAGACDFWIELKEEILGGLQIRLSLAEGRISASLMAKTKEAQRILISRLPELKEQLRHRGMRVAKLEVVLIPNSP